MRFRNGPGYEIGRQSKSVLVVLGLITTSQHCSLVWPIFSRHDDMITVASMYCFIGRHKLILTSSFSRQLM